MSAPPASGGPERAVAAWFALPLLAAVGLIVVYETGGHPQWEGVGLGVAGIGVAVGMALWAHRMMPRGPFTEDRPLLSSSPGEREQFEEDLEEGQLTRRRLIVRTLGASVVTFGVAMLLPLRSLGPRPTDAELDATPWGPGVRLVNENGTPVRDADVANGGLVTVFPEGQVDSESGQAVLMRVDPALLRLPAGREGWAPGGLVAYSKVCTHAGCPVGLYEAGSHELLCPCHQSTFDVLRGAKPVFGPAAVALPQLPLSVDADGNVRATGGFSSPPGPSYWDRSR